MVNYIIHDVSPVQPPWHDTDVITSAPARCSGKRCGPCPCKHHLIDNLVMLGALVCLDRLAVLRHVVYPEPAVESNNRSFRFEQGSSLLCEVKMGIHVPDFAVPRIRAPAPEAEPHTRHATAILRDCDRHQISIVWPYSSREPEQKGRMRSRRTMTMPVPNDLDLARLAVRHMLALHGPENTLLEEEVVALCVSRRLEARLADVERLTRARIRVGLVVCLRSALPIERQ